MARTLHRSRYLTISWSENNRGLKNMAYDRFRSIWIGKLWILYKGAESDNKR